MADGLRQLEIGLGIAVIANNIALSNTLNFWNILISKERKKKYYPLTSPV
jgi:hypothetical protein